jgi:predicted lipid-binding transport protein (Tim44 family)
MTQTTPDGHRPPDHNAPADVGRSVSLMLRWVAAAVVVGLITFGVRRGADGLYLAVGIFLAGALIGFRVSNARSDSDTWQAREAVRRGVATQAQKDRVERARRSGWS